MLLFRSLLQEAHCRHFHHKGAILPPGSCYVVEAECYLWVSRFGLLTSAAFQLFEKHAIKCDFSPLT